MMKKLFSTLVLVLLFVSCSKSEQEVYMFSFFQNNGQDGLHLAYSYDGLSWTALNDNKSFLTPEVGNAKLMRDPCIIKGGDGLFHMVWTVSWNDKGIGYASSPDFIHWSDQQFIPVMEHEQEARNCWAPELFYDKDSSQYMIYWATTIPGRFTETDSSAESAYNHRIYYTTTEDFKTFTDTKLLYDKGFNAIDATIQKNDGKYVMFVKNETKFPKAEKNIRISTSDYLTGGYSEPSAPITDNWVEGPTVVKTDMGWIVYYDKYTRHSMGAVLSDDLKNWTEISDKLNFPKGTRHGSVFKVKQAVLENILNVKKTE